MLIKNTLRSFRHKKVQLFAIGIIVEMSSFLYTTMFYAIDGLKAPLQKYVQDYVQEDFSITGVNRITKSDFDSLNNKDKAYTANKVTYTLEDLKKEDKNLYYKIIQNRISRFKKEFNDFDLELREYKKVQFKKNYGNKEASNKITFIKDNKNINLSYIDNGEKPKKDYEIALSNVYIKENNLNICDYITIKEKKYKITGTVLFPDVTLPIEGSDFIFDNSKITTALVNDNTYDNITGKENFYISGVVKGKEKLKSMSKKDKSSFLNKSEIIMDDFDKNIIEEYKDKDTLDFITDIVKTKNQMRSGVIYDELNSGQAATIGLSIMISSIAVMMVLILIYKIVRNERGQIGILKAMEYSRFEIMTPYILLITLISLPMLIIGHILGVYASNPLKDFYLKFYLIPSGVIQTNPMVLIISIALPIIFILLLSSLLILRMLSKKSIDLLKVSEKEKASKLNKLANRILRNTTSQTKFKYTYILNSMGKFTVFFVGIVFSSMLIIMGFMMTKFFDKMSIDYYKCVDYRYEAYLDAIKGIPNINKGEERFISIPNVEYKEGVINVKGIEDTSKLHKIFNKDSENITRDLKKGIIVNNSFSITYNINIEDTIKIKLDGREYIDKVVGVSKDYGNPTVYINRVDLSKTITQGKDLKKTDSEGYFNGVYSKHKLSEKNYANVIDKNDIMDFSQLIQKFLKVAIYLMIGSAMLVATIVLYILTTLTVEDNYYNISLLKVMGYSKKEVNSMMLNSYLVYAVISYIISIPITVFSLNALIKYYAQKYNMVFPFEFKLWQGVVGLIIVIAIFILGTYASKKRIDKISLQEILKAYRE